MYLYNAYGLVIIAIQKPVYATIQTIRLCMNHHDPNYTHRTV